MYDIWGTFFDIESDKSLSFQFSKLVGESKLSFDQIHAESQSFFAISVSPAFILALAMLLSAK